MAFGRPRKFNSAEEMQEAICEFFANRQEEKRPVTMTGLALHLGFVNRQSMYDYEVRSPAFSDTIKMARTMIEEQYEQALAIGAGNAGHIFALKNFGWSDKTQQEISGPGGEAVKNEYTVKIVSANKD